MGNIEVIEALKKLPEYEKTEEICLQKSWTRGRGKNYS